MYTFISNKSFGQLLDIAPKNVIFLKTFDSEMSYIEVWFTDQNSKRLYIDDRINIPLVINYSVTYKKYHVIQFHEESEYLSAGINFCFLPEI